MANGQNANPLTAPLSVIKSLGETMTQSIQQLGTGLTRTASQGLDALIAGVPPIPGASNPGNSQAKGLQSLLPGNLTQALANIENVLIPPGLPKPSQALGKAAPTPAAPPAPAPAAKGVTGIRRITELGGY